MIDLRSDTVTRPTAEMKEAMFEADVGDDVFGQDPTINALEKKAAALFGKEAAIYCPSGTMTNQIAINLHTRPGEEVVCDRKAHIYNYEGGGIAFNSGCSVRLLEGDRGRFTATQVAENINKDDPHFPRTALVALENSMNKGGGAIYPIEWIREIRSLCDEKALPMHLDGARLFNSLVETGERPREHGALFDTISICMSKGLGAPVGSLLLASSEQIHRARRIRKVFGGGMRQAGYLAAAAIYALDNHVDRLREDNARARKLGEEIGRLDYITEVQPVETNIVLFELDASRPAPEFLDSLAGNDILAVPFGGQWIRMVTHLQFDDGMLDRVVETMNRL